jgi:hypothetical protein
VNLIIKMTLVNKILTFCGKNNIFLLQHETAGKIIRVVIIRVAKCFWYLRDSLDSRHYVIKSKT